MTATIKTRRFEKSVIERKAAQTAARSHDPRATVAAPRGRKTPILEMARAIKRARNAPTDHLATPIRTRLNARLIDQGVDEIASRHLDTPAGWDEFPKRITHRAKVGNSYHYLLSGEGWYEYSKRFGSRYQKAVYLIGTDEGQRFAVRLPATCDSVQEALDWLKPADIRKAEDQGLPVKRQGDIFFRPVRTLKTHEMGGLWGTRHTANTRKDGGLTIVHPQHKPVILSGKYRWRAYGSTQIASAGRRAAD